MRHIRLLCAALVAPAQTRQRGVIGAEQESPPVARSLADQIGDFQARYIDDVLDRDGLPGFARGCA